MDVYILSRGGFGNVLFGYLVGCSIKDRKVIYINSYDGKRKPMKDHEIFKECEMVDAAPGVRVIKEASYTYSPLSIPNESCILDGYYQSYKYCPQVPKELFQKYSRYAEIKAKYLELSQGKETIMMHIRRGDYLGLQNVHPVQTDAYFAEGLTKLGLHRILVFSDDLPFIRQWKLLEGLDSVIVDTTDEIDSFILMSSCTHFIISNSSFSLLAYYFRTRVEGRVVMPSKWFGPSGPAFDLDDLIAPSENRIVL